VHAREQYAALVLKGVPGRCPSHVGHRQRRTCTLRRARQRYCQQLEVAACKTATSVVITSVHQVLIGSLLMHSQTDWQINTS
jgi:hypothetical protein